MIGVALRPNRQSPVNAAQERQDNRAIGRKRMDDEYAGRALQKGRSASETYERQSAKGAQPSR